MSDWNNNLMPFWQLTSEQDWELCEYAQTVIVPTSADPARIQPIKNITLTPSGVSA